MQKIKTLDAVQGHLQMSETFLVGVILAAAGGYLDAYTYLCRDHVFANAQTGNMVLLSMKLAEGEVRQALLYLIPIAAFGLGIAVTEYTRGKMKKSKRIHWRQLVILGEIMILAAVALIPDGRWNMAANVLVSFTCAMQVQSFRKMNGSVFATTMCTGNLRSGTEMLLYYHRNRKKEDRTKGLQYFGIILSFMAGAGAGAFCTKYLQRFAVLPAGALLACVFCMMFVKYE